MSHAGIIGMRSAGADLIDIGRGLDDAEWQTPSAATGWLVRDVISHVGCLLELLQAAVRGEEPPDSGIEAINDAMVSERRGWDNTRILENVQKQLEQAIAAFIPLQDEPMASVETPMLDLGTYSLHAIADMFTFDMTTHLRYDILAPRGPITRQLPKLDDVRLSPSISWLLGGIPKMQTGCADADLGGVGLQFFGQLLRIDGPRRGGWFDVLAAQQPGGRRCQPRCHGENRGDHGQHRSQRRKLVEVSAEELA